MKKIFILFLLGLFATQKGYTQFSANLVGYPVVTTGWNLGGNANVMDSTVQLTHPASSQSGFVYYNTPTNLTTCGQFTVDYDYKIVVTPGIPVADGIAFWYISNPPLSVTGGGGCGIPNNSNGLILILDTYDNNSAAGPDNPLITLLGYNGTVFSYTEGSPVGQLATPAINQFYITDGTWHHVKVVYSSGNISVYVNYSATPILTGFYPMSINGYFGFSSSTGLYYSDQRIKNVHVVSTGVAATPTVVSPVNYCLGATATPLTAGGGGPFSWFTTDTATVVALPGAPTPNTSVAGTTTYYVREGTGTCMSAADSITVIVGTPPAPPIATGVSPYCTGDVFVPYTVTSATGAVAWYTSSTGGTGTGTAPTVNTAVAGTTTFWLTQTVSGCESARDSVTTVVNPTPAAPLLTGTPTYCQYQPYVPLTVTGTNVLWYANATGGTGTATQPTVNTSVPGTYTIYASQSGLGCESPRASFVVTVNAKPAAPAVTPPTYCQLDPAIPLIATGTSLLWYGPGVTPGSAATPIPTTTLAHIDTYYVTQTILGCKSDSARDIVTVKAKPQPPHTRDTSYCQFFAAPALTAGGTNLMWYTTPGGVGSATAPVPPTTIPGNNIWYVTQTVNGCTSNQASLTITTVYIPVFTIAQSRPYVCQYDTLQLSYAGSAAVGGVYNWALPQGASIIGAANGPSVIIQYDSVTFQNVILTVGDVSGLCSNTDTLNILVSSQPSASPYIRQDVCLGDTIALGIAARSDNAATFAWNFAGANIITHNANSGGPYTISWNAPGVHVLQLTAYSAEGCVGKMISDSVKVHLLPDARIVLPAQKGVYCIEDSLLLDAATMDYSNLYTWSPAHFFNENGKPEIWGRIETAGYVKLTVSDPFGCHASDSLLINPDPCCKVSFPSAFTPNGDGKNDIFRPIYHGYHRFSNMRITNRWGETIFESTNNDMSWDGTFNGVPQDMGVYYFFVKYDCGGNSMVEKGDVTLVR